MRGAALSLLRRRDERAEVTQVELFFDLIFVFAVTQISAFLRAHMSLLGGVQSLMLFAAMWWAWVYTSWATNWIDPVLRPVKLLMLGLMFCALLLAASVPEAFAARGVGFAAGLSAMNLGRSGFMLWALKRHDARNYRNFQRIFTWLGAGAVLWLAGAVLAEPERLWLWGVALLVDFIGPAMGFFVPGLGRSTTQDWQVDARHMAERCAAFVLIALGESVTVTGASFSELRWGDATFAAACCALLAVAALWWIYFDDAAERTAKAFVESSDVGRVARAAYTYAHGLLIAAIIAIAAGNAFLLEKPMEKSALGQGLLLLGGPAAFLVGNGIFRRLLHPRFPASHACGLAVLALLAAFAPWCNLLVLSAGGLAALLVTIFVSHNLVRRA